VKRLVLLSLLLMSCGGPLIRQEVPGFSPQAPIERITPVPGRVEVLWSLARLCAGRSLDSARSLREVKWFLRDRFPIPGGGIITGEWVPPDTILITRGFERDPWVITHELLHHALNGPPLPENPLELVHFDPHPVQFDRCGFRFHPVEYEP
jgi:hypothetical protein